MQEATTFIATTQQRLYCLFLQVVLADICARVHWLAALARMLAWPRLRFSHNADGNLLQKTVSLCEEKINVENPDTSGSMEEASS